MFRSWGRVGTTIGGTKLEDFGDLTEAKESFKFQFADKTGNRWSKRKEFAKKAGKMQGRDSTERIEVWLGLPDFFLLEIEVRHSL